MAYTDTEVAAALVAPARTWVFRYQALGGQAYLSTPDVVSCKVSNNYLATGPNRTCSVTFGPDTVFDQLRHSLRVWADLLMPDGGYRAWCVGTFRLSTSSRKMATAAADREQTYDGYDLLLDCQEAKLLDRLVVATGTAYTTAVEAQLVTCGFPVHDIRDSAVTLPAPMEWGPGTPRLTVINDLLTAVNYETLWMTGLGVPTARPYLSPSEAAPVWTYLTDASSVILPGVDSGLDLFNVPNVWLGYVSEPDRPALRSVLVNDDPASVTSTLSRLREIVQVVDTSTLRLTDQTDTAGSTVPAATQADLDALVARAAAESSTIYEQVKMSTGLMPFHGNGDVAFIDYGSGSAAYRQVGWTMDMRAGGTMTQEYRRAVRL